MATGSPVETADRVAGVCICVVCRGSAADNVAVQMGDACLRVCAVCGSWTWFPRESAARQTAVHDNDDYFEHPYFVVRRMVTPALRRRSKDVFLRISKVMDVSRLRGQRLLDIGCDTGVFLSIAHEEFGIVPVGLDVAGRAIQFARESGIEAYHTTIEEAPAQLSGFAVATAIDLIEHVPDPAAFLKAVARRLDPGGVVYVETPNIRSMVYRFGRLLFKLSHGWPKTLMSRLFPPQHIQYFTPASFRRLAQDAGLEVAEFGIRVLPWSDIAASWPALVVIEIFQILDRILGTKILIWAVLRRSLNGPHGK